MYQYFILFLFLFFLFNIIESRAKVMGNPGFSGKINFQGYAKEFYDYSHPLLAYAVVGLIVNIFDRWILQLYGGSIQQGYFGFAYNIGAFCFLFTSALTPLIMREFSIAFEKKDFQKMAEDFRKYIPFFYGLTAYVCCFIAVEAGKVLQILGGAQYKEALWVLIIMSFFPIHQTYGQLSSSVFLAMEKTKLYRNIGVFSMLIGIPIAYFLIAPQAKFGLNAGAIGLALKMVIPQFITVNIHLWFNSKFLKLSFWRYFFHQIGVLAVFLATAMFISFFVDKVVSNVVLEFIISGILYTIVVAGLIFVFPVVLGVTKNDLYYFFKKLKNYQFV